MGREYIMSNNRDVSFDIMKAFAIFLVVLGHCMQSLYPEKGEFVGKPLFLYVYSFHMALFMMISGYFSTRALSGSFKQLIESKTRQLLQPAIVAGGGIIIVEVIIKLISSQGIIIEDEILIFLMDLWFLKLFFILFILSWVIVRLSEKWSFLGVALSVLFAFVTTHLVNVYAIAIYLPCFMLGFILNRINFFEMKKMIMLSVLAVAILSYGYLLRWWDYDFGGYEFFNIRRVASIDRFMIDGLLAEIRRITIGISGGLSVMIVVKLLFSAGRNWKESPFVKSMQEYGAETLGIYCLQAIVLERLMKAFTDFSMVSINVFSFILAPLLSFFVLWLCLCLTKWIHSHEMTNLVVFGRKK